MEELQRRRVAVFCRIVRGGPSERVRRIQIGPSLSTEQELGNLTWISKHSTCTALPDVLKESPLPCYCESNLKKKLGLTVLREGRHVASLGSLFQRNAWRLPPRRGGRGRLRFILFLLLLGASGFRV